MQLGMIWGTPLLKVHVVYMAELRLLEDIHH